ncbi:MAG: hypothetical protein HN413_07935 [Chloroflexi bacterium]|jgi:hypothetical protein|nr:hypothetical protein [Chloroflexota bacterium]
MDFEKLLEGLGIKRGGNSFNKPTQSKAHKKRGIGYTRKSKAQSKTRRKMAKASRRRNRRAR